MITASERIPVAGPSITEREVELAAEAAREAWYQNHYKYNAWFERLMGEYIGIPHAVTVPHCTAALHLALAALGVGPGDEVIVPDVTWIASVAPITYVGAEPVLVDVDQATWCIDPSAVEAAIGPRTKAVIGVDLYGSMCDWDALRAIADKHGLALIEDAAEALGSTYRGKRAGAFGDAAAFSFHGSKTVATGEGGMLVTSRKDINDRVLFLRDHGRTPGDRYFLNTEIGFKYRMNAVTAALGVAQMERIDLLIQHKRKIFSWYRERLKHINGLQMNCEPEGVENSYWMVCVIPDESYGFEKFALMSELDKRNIDSRPFFSQLSTLPAFADRKAALRNLPGTANGAHAARCGINLPSGYNMTEDKADIVARAFEEVLMRRA